MVEDKVIYGVDNVTVIKFGFGTLGLALAIDLCGHHIIIKTIDPMTIGSSYTVGPTVEEFKPEVILSFYNKESFDVFYEVVNQLKKQIYKEIPIKIKDTKSDSLDGSNSKPYVQDEIGQFPKDDCTRLWGIK